VALADGRGRYQLPLARDTAYGFAADADGYAQARLHVETLTGDTHKDITLKPAAQVSGHVVEAPGGPAAGALVRLARDDGGHIPFVMTATSDAAGAFAFRNVVPARYRLWARRGPAAGRLPDALVIGASEVASGLTLALAPAGAVSGRVRSAAGQPVPGVQIWFELEEGTRSQERQATTGTDGGYRIEGALSGSYRVRVLAPGFVAAVAPVAVEGRGGGE